MVIPITANGYQYKCTTAGTSHATTEPTWTTAIGTTITDGTVTWTVDGLQGQEYSEVAPMWCEVQQNDSIRGQRTTNLLLAGMFNRMAKGDFASAEYTLTSADIQTVKTLVTDIANATTACFNHCASWDVQYDTEWDDGLINSFIPADSFRIAEGESRFSVLNSLLSQYTKCRMRPGNDGKLHILNPKVSGVVYDAEYALTVDAHKFLGQSYRKRLIIPGKIWVKSRLSDPTPYSGSATDASSYTLLPHESKPYRYKVVSDAQCALIAAAKLQGAQQDSEKGIAIIPPDIGAELWDYVKVTDKDMSDISRTGNLQYLERTGDLRGKTPQFKMQFTFGKVGSVLGTFTPGLIDTGEEGGSNLAGRIAEIEKAILDLSLIDSELIERTNQFSEGKIYLSDIAIYDTEYDPATKRRVFTATPTTPYVVGDLWLDATTVKRCTTARATGAYDAGDWTATTLDAIAEGATYGKILLTNISAGNIKLTSATVISGKWYDTGGIILEADAGIAIYGANNAFITGNLITTISTFSSGGVGVTNVLCAANHGLTTDDIVRIAGTTNYNGKYTVTVIDATNFTITKAYVAEAGSTDKKVLSVETYVGTDGKLYAGKGNVILSKLGISLSEGAYLRFFAGATFVGYINGLTVGANKWLEITTMPDYKFRLYSHDTIYIASVSTMTLEGNAGFSLNSSGDIILTPGNGAYRTKIYRADTSPVYKSTYVDDVIYQNDTGKLILVIITLQLGGGASHSGYIEVGANSDLSGSTTISGYANASTNDAIDNIVIALVPADYYYRLASSFGTPTIVRWIEASIG